MFVPITNLQLDKLFLIFRIHEIKKDQEGNLDMRAAKEEGLTEGSKTKQEEIARNALAEGASIEFVQKITGLDMEAIEKLKGNREGG